MILASGVQLPNVLIESIDLKNLSNEEFFSDLIENLIRNCEKGNPSNYKSTMKQWKTNEEDQCFPSSSSSSSSFIRIESMNGFQTLLRLVQQKHLGKIENYFLNLRSNRHFHPYDLINVAQHQVRLSSFFFSMMTNSFRSIETIISFFLFLEF